MRRIAIITAASLIGLAAVFFCGWFARAYHDKPAVIEAMNHTAKLDSLLAEGRYREDSLKHVIATAEANADAILDKPPVIERVHAQLPLSRSLALDTLARDLGADPQ